jgi:hypothetical protein
MRCYSHLSDDEREQIGAELGLIDEYEFVVQPRLVPRADVVLGAIEACRLEAREPAGVRLGGGGDAV